jgi:hypothetical protein
MGCLRCGDHSQLGNPPTASNANRPGPTRSPPHPPGLLFFVLKKFNALRIPPEQEQAGLDVSKHGGSAYNNDHGLGKGVRPGF